MPFLTLLGVVCDTLPLKMTSTAFVALLHHIQAGDLEDCQIVLESDPTSTLALLQETDKKGMTPLHWAAFCDQVEIATLLIERGAPINFGIEQEERKGETPLLTAISKGHLRMALVLIKKGADLEQADHMNMSAVHYASKEGQSLCLYALHLIGANLSHVDCHGRTALHHAAYENQPHSCQTLCTMQPELLEATDKDSRTALHWAAMKGHSRICKALIKAGATVYARDSDGLTPLELARRSRFLSLQRHMLLEQMRTAPDGSRIITLRDKPMLLWFMFLLPMISLCFGLYSLLHYPWWGYCLILSFIIFVHVQVEEFLCPVSENTPYPIGFALGSMLYLTFTYIFVLAPDFPAYVANHFVFVVLFFVQGVLLFKAAFTDPGYINAPSINAENLENMLRDGLNESNFCQSCLHRKPLRSKHCAICDCCVARFDHHCPWIFNCVGYKNHHYFWLWLCSIVVDHVLLEFLLVKYWVLLPDLPSFWTVEPYVLLLTEHRYMTVITVMNSLHLIWEGALFLSNTYNIAVNITTNEAINWHRYDYMYRLISPETGRAYGRVLSKFDIGCINNFKQFLHLSPYAVDWSTYRASMVEMV